MSERVYLTEVTSCMHINSTRASTVAGRARGLPVTVLWLPGGVTVGGEGGESGRGAQAQVRVGPVWGHVFGVGAAV